VTTATDKAWGETWREKADAPDPEPPVSAGTLTAADLVVQVNRELGRQRGWSTGADGYYGPYGS
jgi:hypothetical protein